jgi:hypothetical protein
MAVAENLGKFAHEVEELTPDELADWLAYFKLKREAEKKAQDEARAKAKANARRPGRR